MERTIETETKFAADRLFLTMSDLSIYPEWLELVSQADPVDLNPNGLKLNHQGDAAWEVTLRAKIGPFSRSKLLRMVRTVADSPTRIKFERSELDGREHSPWEMAVNIAPTNTGSNLSLTLSYGGSLWSGPLDAVLKQYVDSAVPRLETYMAKQAPNKEAPNEEE